MAETTAFYARRKWVLVIPTWTFCIYGNFDTVGFFFLFGSLMAEACLFSIYLSIYMYISARCRLIYMYISFPVFHLGLVRIYLLNLIDVICLPYIPIYQTILSRRIIITIMYITILTRKSLPSPIRQNYVIAHQSTCICKK